MSSYRLIVYTNPVAGREDEYNHWYTHQHLDDVIAVPGVIAAQRFKLVGKLVGPDSGIAYQYLAIYEIETDDVQNTIAELTKRPGTSAMVMSDAVDTSTALGTLFEEIEPRRV